MNLYLNQNLCEFNAVFLRTDEELYFSLMLLMTPSGKGYFFIGHPLKWGIFLIRLSHLCNKYIHYTVIHLYRLLLGNIIIILNCYFQNEWNI